MKKRYVVLVSCIVLGLAMAPVSYSTPSEGPYYYPHLGHLLEFPNGPNCTPGIEDYQVDSYFGVSILPCGDLPGWINDAINIFVVWFDTPYGLINKSPRERIENAIGQSLPPTQDIVAWIFTFIVPPDIPQKVIPGWCANLRDYAKLNDVCCGLTIHGTVDISPLGFLDWNWCNRTLTSRFTTPMVNQSGNLLEVNFLIDQFRMNFVMYPDLNTRNISWRAIQRVIWDLTQDLSLPGTHQNGYICLTNKDLEDVDILKTWIAGLDLEGNIPICAFCYLTIVIYCEGGQEILVEVPWWLYLILYDLH